jgi:DNA-directed RNA polymerase specialized sigma24 family protein
MTFLLQITHRKYLELLRKARRRTFVSNRCLDLAALDYRLGLSLSERATLQKETKRLATSWNELIKKTSSLRKAVERGEVIEKDPIVFVERDEDKRLLEIEDE